MVTHIIIFIMNNSRQLNPYRLLLHSKNLLDMTRIIIWENLCEKIHMKRVLFLLS